MFFVRKAGARTSTTAHAASLNPGDEIQQQVFELVSERLRSAFGASGMWNVTLRKTGDTETLFGVTVAESLAWDVAAHLAPASTTHVGAHQQSVAGSVLAGSALAGSVLAGSALAGSADVVAPGPAQPAQEVFVTPVFSSFGPPVLVAVPVGLSVDMPVGVPVSLPVGLPVGVPGLAAASASAVTADYVGPPEWSRYGPPSLESLVQSVASPAAQAGPARDIHTSVA